ncbi:MAG: hypothetical protein ACTSSA_09775 [Candidatus Freyarchaeota archaeon]
MLKPSPPAAGASTASRKANTTSRTWPPPLGATSPTASPGRSLLS